VARRGHLLALVHVHAGAGLVRRESLGARAGVPPVHVGARRVAAAAVFARRAFVDVLAAAGRPAVTRSAGARPVRLADRVGGVVATGTVALRGALRARRARLAVPGRPRRAGVADGGAAVDSAEAVRAAHLGVGHRRVAERRARLVAVAREARITRAVVAAE